MQRKQMIEVSFIKFTLINVIIRDLLNYQSLIKIDKSQVLFHNVKIQNVEILLNLM